MSRIAEYHYGCYSLCCRDMRLAVDSMGSGIIDEEGQLHIVLSGVKELIICCPWCGDPEPIMRRGKEE